MTLMLALAMPSLYAKTYEAIPKESKISYSLHHPLHQVHGSSNEFLCSVDLPGDTLQAQIHVKVAIATFNSGNSNRDSHALEMLGAYKNPYVELVSDSLKKEKDGYRVFGKLSLHGQTHLVNFLVKPTYVPNRVRIQGGFSIRLSAYGVKRPTLLFVPTDDELKIEIDVAALQP